MVELAPLVQAEERQVMSVLSPEEVPAVQREEAQEPVALVKFA